MVTGLIEVAGQRRPLGLNDPTVLCTRQGLGFDIKRIFSLTVLVKEARQFEILKKIDFSFFLNSSLKP